MRFFKLRVMPLFAIFALIASAIGITVMLYWSLASQDVLEVKNAPVSVRTIRNHPSADGVIILNISYCKKVAAPGRARISFISTSREIFLPTSPDRQPAACADNQDIPIVLPKDIPPDKYHVHFRISYDINPLKRGIIEEFDSQEFEVAQ